MSFEEVRAARPSVLQWDAVCAGVSDQTGLPTDGHGHGWPGEHARIPNL